MPHEDNENANNRFNTNVYLCNLELLTVNGIVKRMNGNFRPNLSATMPKVAKPIRAPNAFNDAIHEASSWLILPVGNGDASDVSKTIIGLDRPVIIP